VAGIDMDDIRWIRPFPVPFRDMPSDRRFRKFDIIELRKSDVVVPDPLGPST
jgi:hypothetical protein